MRTIQRVEAGQPPNLETLKSLAASFDTTIEVLSIFEQDRRQIADELQENYSLVELEVADRGTQLAAAIAGSDAFHLTRVGDLSDDREDVIAELSQAMRDVSDVWTDLGAVQQREMEKFLHEILERVRAAEVTISFGHDKMKLKGKNLEEPLRFCVLNVAAVPGANPLRCIVRDKREPISFA